MQFLQEKILNCFFIKKNHKTLFLYLDNKNINKNN